jgi:hypothetical protein
MKSHFSVVRAVKFAFAAALSVLAFSAGLAGAAESKVTLTGAEETPPVKTTATAVATITVNADKSVSGSVTARGLVGATIAHIHLGAVGQKGGPIVTLDKSGDNTWVVPAGAKFTDEQYAAYQAGNLYINVHSDANKAGEIRGQIKP